MTRHALVRSTVRRWTAGMLAAVVLAAAPAAEAGEAVPHDRRATQAGLERLVEEVGVPGAGAWASDAHGSWYGSAGVADLDAGRERTEEEHFRAGSVTKMFVATVLLQLQDEGRLSLDDALDAWLSELPTEGGVDPGAVTLRHLLNHTSGIRSYTEDEEFERQRLAGDGFLRNRYRTENPDDLIRRGMTAPPLFEPGAGWAYSNTNYVLAGAVIERVTGNTYAGEIRRRIITPLGLRSTSLPGQHLRLPSPHPVLYSTLRIHDLDAPVHDATWQNPSWVGAAGELISSGKDVNRFLRALYGGELLPPEQLAQMLDTVAADTPLRRAGLGVFAYPLSCGTTVWGHEGNMHGSPVLAVGDGGGDHSFTLHLNGDRRVGPSALLGIVETEYCGPQANRRAS
ncbi:serine hydrolase domain-containing protein [Streptomyces albidoflavus]